MLASNGALTVVTGKRTGRSHDRYVKETSKNDIEWGEINSLFMKRNFIPFGLKLRPIWKTKKSS